MAPKKAKKIQYKKCNGCKGNKICGDCKGTGQIRVVHSRNKGSSFERSVAQEISKWTGSVVTRTPMSGGYNKFGDITPKDPALMISFPYCIELKNREAWDFSELLKGTNIKTGILSWWQQVLGDAGKSKKHPLLIFTKNLEPNYGLTFSKIFEATFEVLPVHFKIYDLRIFLFEELLKVPYNQVEMRLSKSHSN